MELLRITRRHQLITDSFRLKEPLDPASEKLILLLSQVTRIAGASSIPYISQYERVGVADTQIVILKIEMLPEHENEQEYTPKLVINRVMFTWNLISLGSPSFVIRVYLDPHAPANGPEVHKEVEEFH